MSISVQQLTKTYGQQKAVNDISFEVPAGQVVGFLGPNGAGKTTTMKMLTCFIPPTSGIAIVCGLDVEENSVEVRSLVGYLPEHNPLYLDMYVKEYLDFAAEINKVKNVKERVSEMIEITGLTLEKRKKIGQLSKGYRQRVGLAQAMIHNPKVLILDEPTSGLDPNQIGEIRNLIRTIGKEKTVLLSTHIMQEVEAMCDRAIIINRGTIVADDNTANLRNSLKTESVITVQFKNAVSEDKLRKIPGITKVSSAGDNRWNLHSAGNEGLQESIFKFAVDNNLVLLESKLSESSLEDVFKSLTR
ncbi:MAG: gliding motility-associated ABC transporter ATP-binding subunit GldA [Bacteroidia bacterium]|nr:gliding motility-associated ABC transporter ATP-binding subunit GldA [Bacteroidia bacterium]